MVLTPQMAISHLVMTIGVGISQKKNIKNFDDVQILWNDPYEKIMFTKSATDSHSCPPVLPGAHAVQVPLGLEVYLVVEGDHDQHWQPERDAGRHDGVGRVDDELALLRVLVLVEKILVGRVPAEEDGQEGDAGGRQPGQEDHHHRRSHRDRGVVH